MNFETKRMRGVQAPVIPIVGELIRKNPGTISLGQGVVSYGPPPEALAAIQEFSRDAENHKYKAVEGIDPLIAALRAKLETENRVRISGERRIVVTAGGNMAFAEALTAITDPGDEIILLRPFYFNHEMAVVLADCKPVVVDTDEDYQIDVEAIRASITPRTRAVVTISPNNPTGAVYFGSSLCEVNALCRDRGIFHIHDEAYEYFTYGVEHFSPASIPDSAGHTISLFSLSKAYGFASWRIGWMVIPRDLFVAVKKIQDTLLICPPVISQFAALGALEAGKSYCAPFLKDLAETRNLVLNSLREIGDVCTVPRADGAFYFLLNVRTKLSAMEAIERLVTQHRVAAIPGSAFGFSSDCRLRISYGALQREQVAEGIGRLVRGIKEISSTR